MSDSREVPIAKSGEVLSLDLLNWERSLQFKERCLIFQRWRKVRTAIVAEKKRSARSWQMRPRRANVGCCCARQLLTVPAKFLDTWQVQFLQDECRLDFERIEWLYWEFSRLQWAGSDTPRPQKSYITARNFIRAVLNESFEELDFWGHSLCAFFHLAPVDGGRSTSSHAGEQQNQNDSSRLSTYSSIETTPSLKRTHSRVTFLDFCHCIVSFCTWPEEDLWKLCFWCYNQDRNAVLEGRELLAVFGHVLEIRCANQPTLLQRICSFGLGRTHCKAAACRPPGARKTSTAQEVPDFETIAEFLAFLGKSSSMITAAAGAIGNAQISTVAQPVHRKSVQDNNSRKTSRMPLIARSSADMDEEKRAAVAPSLFVDASQARIHHLDHLILAVAREARRDFPNISGDKSAKHDTYLKTLESARQKLHDLLVADSKAAQSARLREAAAMRAKTRAQNQRGKGEQATNTGQEQNSERQEQNANAPSEQSPPPETIEAIRAERARQVRQTEERERILRARITHFEALLAGGLEYCDFQELGTKYPQLLNPLRNLLIPTLFVIVQLCRSWSSLCAGTAGRNCCRTSTKKASVWSCSMDAGAKSSGACKVRKQSKWRGFFLKCICAA
eukprot:INCI10408.1.p1 GENE.INCI10408.1~~INCI10408.1.p1  ORF type:complete len:618 (+),score=78.03 INCI10408.1:263-2116(+)